jgi:hypothetical protein
MNYFQAIAARLESDWPGYQFWYVPKAVGGFIWCARREDDHRHVINAGSPDELEERLAGEEG